MYINIDFFRSRVEQTRNLFSTFGCFMVRECIDNEYVDLFREGFESVRCASNSYSAGDVERNLFRSSTIEEFSEFKSLFFTSPILDVVRNVLGDDFLYLGSDVSSWTGQTQPWHRDWLLQTPVLKVGIYLDPHQVRVGGELRIIPGSHHLNDRFSKLLGFALDWPEGSRDAVGGGMNKNGFLPANYAYSNVVIDESGYHLLDDVGRPIWRGIPNQISIPHVALKPQTSRDVVFFDNRCIHSGTVSIPGRKRIMATATFSCNPTNIRFLEDKFYYKASDLEKASESLAKLLIIDRLFHGNSHSYHPHGLLPDISRRNQITLDFNTSNAYNCYFGENLHTAHCVPMNFLDGIAGANIKEKLLKYLSLMYI